MYKIKSERSQIQDDKQNEILTFFEMEKEAPTLIEIKKEVEVQISDCDMENEEDREKNDESYSSANFQQSLSNKLKTDNSINVDVKIEQNTNFPVSSENIEKKRHTVILRTEYEVQRGRPVQILNEIDKDRPVYECGQCKYETRNKHQFLDHLRDRKRPYRCSYCDQTFLYKCAFRIHCSTHTEERKPFIKCPQCTHSFSIENSVKTHDNLTVEHNSGSLVAKSDAECKKNDNGKCTNKATVDQTCNGKKVYKCSKCTFESCYEMHYLVHRRTHRKNNWFECIHCKFSTLQERTLQNHLLTHTEKKSYQCAKCTYATKSNLALQVHLWSHTNEKPFKCPHCTHRTNRKAALKTHLYTHSEKVHRCSRCSYVGSSIILLKIHIQSHVKRDSLTAYIADTKVEL